MVIFFHPIIHNPFSYQGQNVAGQMCDPHPGKNKKTGVVGYEVDILLTGLVIPANEIVPGRGSLRG